MQTQYTHLSTVWCLVQAVLYGWYFELLFTGHKGSEEFLHTVFAVVESVAQHPDILAEYHTLVINHMLPPLAVMVTSSSGMSSCCLCMNE